MLHSCQVFAGILCLCFSSACISKKQVVSPSVQEKPRSVPPPLVADKPSTQTVAQKVQVSKPQVNPPSKYRSIFAQVNINLRDKRSVRTRSTSFQTWVGRRRVKKIRMRHGGVWLNFDVTVGSKRILLKGAFRAGEYVFPIRKKSSLLSEARPTWNMTFVHNHSKKNVGVEITVRAKLQAQSARSGGKSYQVSFANVSLRRVMRRLAQFNNLKLSWSSSVRNVSRLTLKLKAKKRIALIFEACKRYKLNCRVQGGALLIKPSMNASPGPRP